MWLEDDLGGRTGPSVAYFVNPVMVKLPPRVGKISFLVILRCFLDVALKRYNGWASSMQLYRNLSML